MACNCDVEWGQFCVIEIGSEVQFTDHYKQLWGKDDSNEVWMPIIPLDLDVEEIWSELSTGYRRNLMAALPEFRLKGDKHCPTGNKERFCNQTYDSSDSANFYYDLDEKVISLSRGLYDELNYIRETDSNGRKAALFNPYALDEALKWSTSMSPFDYDLALEMAAIHVAQIEGPCTTTGDANGDTVEQVLRKYYAYDVKNLQVLKVESTQLLQNKPYPSNWKTGGSVVDKTLINTDFYPQPHDFIASTGHNYESAQWAIEYILSQNCIDKRILGQDYSGPNIKIGVGCSCSTKDSGVEGLDNYLCYILVA